MADNKQLRRYVTTEGIGQEVIKMMNYAYNQRRQFERKWYENNFFDDGYHFRYVSRTTGKIVDVGELNSANMPQRSIPKASRQIRGIANLVLGMEPTPSVYPERITKAMYSDPQAYMQAMEQAKDIAKKTGYWITSEWKDQHLKEKLILMMILAAKQSVSFVKIWPGRGSELKTKVLDAFDVYLMGNFQDIQECPFIIEATPMLFDEVASNPNFDPAQIDKLNADNKMASSDIKQVYMQTRFGSGMTADNASTVILNEAFIKERLSSENAQIIAMKAPEALKGKQMGDCVLRHSFSANGVWLMDEYLEFDDYPFVDFRYEPGPIYQKPLIENFIPANKSLDIIVSRLEKWANTMVTGTWMKRKGENFEITNVPGGQVVEYAQTPPVQANMASPPQATFQIVGLLEKFIEEQGASTSALGNLPTGVKSGIAIESVKATEYANLKITTDMVKETVRRISEMMIKVASKNFVKPKPVYQMGDDNKPDYFDVMGQTGIDKYKELGLEAPQGVVPIKDDVRVDIQIEAGMGYTEDGRKNTMQQIIGFVMPLVQMGMVTQDAVKIIINKTLETYGFGATQDLMDALDKGQQAGALNEDQLMQLKVALAETMKDMGAVGPEHDQKMVDSTKVGVVEALKDTGMLDNQSNQTSAKEPSKSISFKDLPPEGKAQLAAQAGIDITPQSAMAQEEKGLQNAFKREPII